MQIKTIGISGAGTMGSGIAQIFSRRGINVILLDLKEEFLEKSKGLIEVFNENLIEVDLMSKEEDKTVFEHIKFTTDMADFAEADLIIETIVEKLEVKQAHWKELEAVAKEGAIFTTNTSGLSINAISQGVKNKDRFMGTHFFNPAHIIPLVEIIRGDETKDEVVDALESLLITIKKKPVVVNKDVNGFIANRLQFAMFREALYILEEGIGSPKAIDDAVRFGPGFRYPIIGPLQTADFGGLDTFNNISSYLFEDLADNKEPNKVLADLVENEDLGYKSGQGFFDYSGNIGREEIRRRDRKLMDMLKHIYE